MPRKTSLDYPSWSDLINSLISELYASGLTVPHDKQITVGELNLRLKQLKNIISEYAPSRIHEILTHSVAHYVPNEQYDLLMDRVRSIPYSPNEFYAVFNIEMNEFTQVDPKVEKVLGISPSDFTIQNLLATEGPSKLSHPADVHHWVRWGVLAYLLLSLPFFEYSSMDNCITLRFRIDTSGSRIDALSRSGYVLVEQRSFPFYEQGADGRARPVYHIDRWTIGDVSRADGTRPECMSTPQHSPWLNSLLYFLNASMIGISPKYVLMLNERDNSDRNKAAAVSINAKIHKLHQLDAGLDDIIIGNYFVKTIRQKLADAINFWEKRHRADKVTMDSDLEAIHAARALGLIPLTAEDEQRIIQGIVRRTFDSPEEQIADENDGI